MNLFPIYADNVDGVSSKSFVHAVLITVSSFVPIYLITFQGKCLISPVFGVFSSPFP